ncbi:MAG: MFS transporter [Ruminiclostridium sp.]
MNINNKLKRNISISYVYSFLMQLNITSAIWVLYLAFKGMSLVEIGFLEAIYHITGLFFELPTGAIADIYGKKFSVIAGRIVSVIACILMITSFMQNLSIVFFILTSITGGLNFSIFSDYINTRIPSEYRATILSFDSLCFSVFMICVFPLFGLLAQKGGFPITFGIIALLYIPVIIFLLLKLRKHNEAIIGGVINLSYAGNGDKND